jgi:transposase-like protein
MSDLALCTGTLGMKVDHSTLHRWKDRHSEKYLSLQREILPKLREEAAERHSAVADREMELDSSSLINSKPRRPTYQRETSRLRSATST